MEVKHNCSDCIYHNDFLAPCDWLTRQKILVLNCQHYKKARNPWKRINDAFSSLCVKEEEVMYKSPISIYETAVQTIMEQRENAIFAKVQDAFDVQVDKKELIRALMYDRNQYEKGYFDGKEEAIPKWVPATELLPEADKEVLCFTKRGYCWIARWNTVNDRMWSDGETWGSESEVTHWMPLPEAPKED